MMSKYAAIATGERVYKVAVLIDGEWKPIGLSEHFDTFHCADAMARLVASGKVPSYNKGEYINMR